MSISHLKFTVRILVPVCATVLAAAGLTFNGARAQTKTPDASVSVTAEQQKQLNHLRQLAGQLQKDRDAVGATVGEYGWDSNEADAAQQQLFQDRQEYRSVRRSLQAAGVSIPSDAMGGGMGSQSTQNADCYGHRHRHHDCCDGQHDCPGHNGDCGHDGDRCYHGHCN